MEIENKKWQDAIKHLQEMREMARSLGWAGSFYVMGCDELERKYNDGDRSKKLYNEIMDLH